MAASYETHVLRAENNDLMPVVVLDSKTVIRRGVLDLAIKTQVVAAARKSCSMVHTVTFALNAEWKPSPRPLCEV